MLRLNKLVGHLSKFAANRGAKPKAEDLLVIPQGFHRDLLADLNGFTAHEGTVRLFGVARSDSLDIESWNDFKTWRFAWDERVDPFFCFGSNAWGDQYAYRHQVDGALGTEIYFLEGVLLRPTMIFDSFEAFAHEELLRVATLPYDSMTVKTLEELGPLEPADLWAYSPSIALGGVESVESAIRLDAATAMVFAGDIASALSNSKPGAEPVGVDTWTDDHRRSRLQVLFDQ